MDREVNVKETQEDVEVCPLCGAGGGLVSLNDVLLCPLCNAEELGEDEK